jgi:hypothetical protein
MPNRWPISSGNWSNSAIWSGSIIPTASDDVFANNRIVTIDQDITVASLKNSTSIGGTGIAGGISASGQFILNDYITITTLELGIYSTNPVCVLYSGSFSSSIIADCYGSHAVDTIPGVLNSGSGTLNIIGNGYGSGNFPFPGSRSVTPGITNRSTGTINILGNGYGGLGAGLSDGIRNNGTGTINITGSLYSLLINSSITNAGARNSSTGTINISGSVVSDTGIGLSNDSTGVVTVIGPVYASNVVVGISSTSTGTVIATGPFYNTNNRNAVFTQNLQLISGSTPTWTFDTETYGEQRTLYTADYPGNFPSSTDVRDGITFGDTSQFTGVVAIPSTGSVLKGVPVGNTTGSASFDIQNVWGVNTNLLTTTGSLGARLRNVATVATAGDAIASKGTL